MRFEDYTKDQQKAIVLKGTNIIVSAGAGSGKTQVLTERVIHFIEKENYKLEEFLILTFTKLAAAEMKERIRKALNAKGLKEAENVDVSDISTFDAYALSIVKKYHLKLNLSQNVAIIDNNIIKVKERTILNEIFEELYADNDEEFKKIIRDYCFKDDENIKELILSFYNQALLEIDTDSYLNDFIDNYYDEKHISFYKQELLKIINNGEIKERIINLLDILPDISVSKKDSRLFKEVVKNQLQSYLSSETYLETVNAFDDFMGFLPCPRNKELTDEDKDNYANIKEEINKVKGIIDGLPKSEEEFSNYYLKQIPHIKKIIAIIKELDKRIVAYKNEYQAFEFQDIAKMAIKIVKENESIKNELKNKLKMIMIDEYQDTSLIQETFISYIANNNIYMVGDVKQSIYRFRNARSDIFIDKYNKYKNNIGGIAIDLNKNFRSRKEVLEDINFIFKQIMTPTYGGADYKKDHLIEYGNKDYLKAGSNIEGNHIEFICYERDNKSIAETEAEIIVKDIIEKINRHYKVMAYDENRNPYLRDCKFSDFCIIMDRGSEFETYSKIFNLYKVPLFVEKDENIKDNIIVKVLTNILILIKAIKNNDYSGSEFLKAFLSISRSFLFEYDDNLLLKICKEKSFEKDPIVLKLKEIIAEYAYLSISDLFEKIIFELKFYEKCILIGNVVKSEKYLETFLEMFKTMSKLDFTVEDFIDYMENIDKYSLEITLSSSSSDFDSVRIMNIHKSKGLEFNIVYYSGLAKKFNQRDLKAEYGCSKKYGLIMPNDNPDDFNIVKALNSEFEKKEDISEKIRLFYVALTRTREKMIFIVDKEKINGINISIDKINVNQEFLKRIFDSYEKKEISSGIMTEVLNIYSLDISSDIEKTDIILTKKEFVMSIKQLYSQGNIKHQDVLKIFKLYFKYIPFEKDIYEVLNFYEIGLIDFDNVLLILNELGFKFDNSLVNREDILGKAEINDNYFNNVLKKEKFNHEILLNVLFKEFKNQKISFDILNKIGHLLKYEFIKMSLNEYESFDEIDDLVEKKGNIFIKELDTANSLNSFFLFQEIMSNHKFHYELYNPKYEVSLNNSVKTIKHENLIIEDINVESAIIDVFRPSEILNSFSSKNNIDFGIEIHFIMEIIDFKNPDYSILNNFYKSIVKRFLNSFLMKNVKNSIIYKEYEFLDEENNIKGIIDLLIVYDTHIDLIDYKTKDIEDAAYEKQLTIYKNHIEKTFNKEVHTYLYSLLQGNYKQIN